MSDINSPAPDSMVAQLRANRARLLADTKKALQVPGWDSLYVQYKRLPWTDMKPLATALGANEDDPTREVGNVIDVLIAGCDTFLFKGDDEFQDLSVRYEHGLAQFGVIDDDVTSAPAIVLSVFANDEVALMSHAGEYMNWAMRQEAKVDEQLGKASGRTDE